MTNFIQRPTWDDTWIAVAKTIAQRSLCVRDQVGAVIVDKQNRIVSTGYNGPPMGFQHNDKPCINWCNRSKTVEIDSLTIENIPQEITHKDPNYHDCPSLHAEANALSVCDRLVREDGTIYVTSAICFGCAKLIANSGLGRVVISYSKEYSHRNAEQSYQFLTDCEVEVDIL